MCLEAAFTENDFVNATKNTKNKDTTKDFSSRARTRTWVSRTRTRTMTWAPRTRTRTRTFLKDSLRTRTRTTILHQTHGDNFVTSYRIFSIRSVLERELNFRQNPSHAGIVSKRLNISNFLTAWYPHQCHHSSFFMPNVMVIFGRGTPPTGGTLHVGAVRKITVFDHCESLYLGNDIR